jgi:hypothetical protein
MSDDAVERLVRIETRLDELLSRFDRHESYRDSLHTDHEHRLRRIEAAKWRLAGMCAGIGGAAGFVAALLRTV